LIYAHASSAEISVVFDEVKNSEPGQNYAFLRDLQSGRKCATLMQAVGPFYLVTHGVLFSPYDSGVVAYAQSHRAFYLIKYSLSEKLTNCK